MVKSTSESVFSYRDLPPMSHICEMWIVTIKQCDQIKFMAKYYLHKLMFHVNVGDAQKKHDLSEKEECILAEQPLLFIHLIWTQI